MDGLADAARTTRTIATGLMALGIGWGFWWNYFDFVGRRRPRAGALARAAWIYGHFPLSLTIVATGAGMVSLIEHAGDNRTPQNVAWLLSVATAGVALSLAGLTATMRPHQGRRLVPFTLTAAAVIALTLGALRPNPIVLAIGLYATLFAVWIESFVRHAQTGTSIVAS